MIEAMKAIKAIAMDVDGVLTDGGLWITTSGEESKRFSFSDVTAIGLARKADIKLALISGESSPGGMNLVDRYSARLKITNVYKACHDKPAAVRDFAEKNGLQLSEICFIGDDYIDAPAMEIVGLAVAPADAQECAKASVREVVDAILKIRATPVS